MIVGSTEEMASLLEFRIFGPVPIPAVVLGREVADRGCVLHVQEPGRNGFLAGEQVAGIVAEQGVDVPAGQGFFLAILFKSDCDLINTRFFKITKIDTPSIFISVNFCFLRAAIPCNR